MEGLWREGLDIFHLYVALHLFLTFSLIKVSSFPNIHALHTHLSLFFSKYSRTTCTFKSLLFQIFTHYMSLLFQIFTHHMHPGQRRLFRRLPLHRQILPHRIRLRRHKNLSLGILRLLSPQTTLPPTPSTTPTTLPRSNPTTPTERRPSPETSKRDGGGGAAARPTQRRWRRCCHREGRTHRPRLRASPRRGCARAVLGRWRPCGARCASGVLVGLCGDYGSVGRGSRVEEAGGCVSLCMCVFLPDSMVTLDRLGGVRVWKRPGAV
jgi:hypothetical protein